jgi:glutamate dehydrogenase
LKLRLFNPSQGVDGWQSPHTVVAMLNDDMPFIIDSVTAYLTAQHLTIHRLIHPVLRVGRDSSGALGDLHDAARNGGA